MKDDLTPVTDPLIERLQAWLDRPSPLSEQIEGLREQVKALRSGMKTPALDETLKQLERADAEAQRVRRRQAAEAIASACKGLGIVLEPKDPPKRVRRQKAHKAGRPPGQPTV